MPEIRVKKKNELKKYLPRYLTEETTLHNLKIGNSILILLIFQSLMSQILKIMPMKKKEIILLI